MKFVPVELVMKRVENYGDTDSARFNELLYAGELIIKTTVSAFVASIDDDCENHRYSMLHALIRANGIGEWTRKLDETITGPASHYLSHALRDNQRAFTERLGQGSWQYNATYQLHRVLFRIYPNAEPIAEKIALRRWFTLFTELRNKTRGHGAITPAMCAELVPQLQDSIQLIATNNPIFQRSWAYLHRNLSGKYNVNPIGGDQSIFSPLKTSGGAQGSNYANGVYLDAGGLRRVELIHSDSNITDFFFPNGSFNGRNYELHSILTDNRSQADARPYLAPAGNRPDSETQGKGKLDVIGNVFTNLPKFPNGYVKRPMLENKVKDILTNDRHPVVTLVGRGGIGKTSVALAVLHKIARLKCYSVIVWFSARDIDLTPTGPKIVQPKILAENDIAEEYGALIGTPREDDEGKNISLQSIMAEHMRSSSLGATLFIFDNFETVRNPVDLFQWIDTNVRLPNKAVITTRFRDFKADYPIEITGMEHREAEELVNKTAIFLCINDIISTSQRDQIIEESDGHPYIIKIILGEISNKGRYGKPSALIVRKDEILDALFDRTFANLSPMASRIFLTLSGWRSLVPELAIEAVLLRYGSDGNPKDAINELVRMSLAERTQAQDGSDFLGIPLAAALFGKKKLEVSPQRALIESDLKFLRDIGPTSTTDLHKGLYPSLKILFQKIARRISDGSQSLDELRSILEFFSRSYPSVWLLLSDLQEEIGGNVGLDKAAVYVRNYLETKPAPEEAQDAWQRLISIYRKNDDIIACCSAFLGASEISEPSLYDTSTMANWLNSDRDLIDQMELVQRDALFGQLTAIMERHIADASATDLSRLAWLHLHAGDGIRARELADQGLRLEPENLHCERLVKRLTG